ncbi:MAG: type II secretion system protein GspM [Sphingobium sp.]
MSERFRTWLRDRSPREQRLLMVMIALMAVVIAWLFVRTMDDALSDARERHTRAVIEQAEVKGKVAALKALERGAGRRLEAPVDVVVGQSASEVGFVLSRTEPQGRARVVIAIASARPQAFFGWLNDLEGRGVFPERLTARANSDQTLSIEGTMRGRGL